MVDPIEEVIQKWHLATRGELPGGLDELLADDVVFYSPVVFTPQVGKEVTKLYLRAATNTLGKSIGADPGDSAHEGDKPLHYTKQVLSGHQAALEFERVSEGKFTNGVDIITCNDDGKISEFRVMIRPLQAIQQIHKEMAAMLEKLQNG